MAQNHLKLKMTKALNYSPPNSSPSLPSDLPHSVEEPLILPVHRLAVLKLYFSPCSPAIRLAQVIFFLLLLLPLTTSGPFNFKLIPRKKLWLVSPPQAPLYPACATTLVFLKHTTFHQALSLLKTFGVLPSLPSHNLYGQRQRLASVWQPKLLP